MNINLSRVASKAKAGSTSVESNKNVFGASSDEDEDGRQAVNQAIRKEQDALRRRAEAAINEASSTDVYDYDGAYDSFQKKEEPKTEMKGEDRSSRYIGDLLKAAEKRKRGRDLIYERKVAREQAAEDAEADYSGKEKFVTAGYKKKLQERELWLAEEQKEREEEERNDVTKKTGGAAMATFYGNFNKNVAMGAVEASSSPEQKKMGAEEGGDGEAPGATRHREDSHYRKRRSSSDEGSQFESGEEKTSESRALMGEENDPELQKLEMRKMRERKVQEARSRYFQRHGIEVASS